MGQDRKLACQNNPGNIQTKTLMMFLCCMCLRLYIVHSFILCLAMQEFIEPVTAVKQYSLQMIAIHLADCLDE